VILAIDAGNTHIVLGCIDGRSIARVYRMVTDIHRTEDQYSVDIQNILRLGDIDAGSFTGAIISSVVPQLSSVLQLVVRRLTGRRTLMVGAGIKTGLNILIDNPSELGSDMVCTAVAALERHAPPLVIVDMGTATKISAVNRNGSFIGCSIGPGVAISAGALFQGASLLPSVSIEAPKKYIGTNTTDSLNSGIVYGAAAQVDGLVTRFFEELGGECKVLATGGLAHKIVPHCRVGMEHDANLLLDGLRILYEKNQKL